MEKVSGSLKVYFEEPFWVGVFEVVKNNALSAAKVTFGAEPKDAEIYELVLKHYYGLKFSPSVKAAVCERKKNPKKMQREIKKSLLNIGTGTKSQQALKLQQEQNKTERKVKSRVKKDAEAKLLFELKRQKKKEKHRGR